MKNKLTSLLSKVTTVSLLAMSLVSVSPALAATPTGVSDTMTRLKVSVSSIHAVTFTLAVASGDTVTLNYSAVSTGSLASITGGACGTGSSLVDSGSQVLTLTAGTGGCSSVSFGFTATNVGSAGSKTVTFGGTSATGTFQIPLVTDDQVTVTATVSPTMTFNVGANATCDGTFAGNGGTVALGTLSTAAISSSEVSSVNVICTRLSSNATGGTTVTVKSTNASLMSTSATADTIPSASVAMAIGTSNYGLCDGSSGGASGKDVTTPTGGTLAASAPFNGACLDSTAAGTVGALTTSAQNVWSVNDAVSNGYWKLFIKAAISGTQPAHNDYTDTLTFIATGTF